MILRYFNEEEDPLIKCQCGQCGKGLADMDLGFMLRVDEARHRAGIPFHVTSGIRCRKHNNDVSTTGFDGPHTRGALDLAYRTSSQLFIMLEALQSVGFTRFGIKPGSFLHVDDDPRFIPKVMWFYPLTAK